MNMILDATHPLRHSAPTAETNWADVYRPRFHFTAPSHWINDPNGICYHDGKYHLYYQHNPDAAKWGNIHWGHASSTDLTHWQDELQALAPTPDGPDAEGCFSGSFALIDGVPTLYYTGFTQQAQKQCMATSADLQTWTKLPDAIIAEPPEGVAPQDFRDPYVFRHDGYWYMALGASLRGERGQCLLYRSDDGRDWHYRHPLFVAPDRTLGVMWECPNFFALGDKWVLSFSQWLGLGVNYFVGRFEDERFIPENQGILDIDGSAFAHLTMRAPDERTLQWAWILERREQEQIDADGWAGAMSVPRELGLGQDGALTLRPVGELARLRKEKVAQAQTRGQQGTVHRFTGRFLDIEARFTLHDIGKVGLTVLSSHDGSETTRIVYHPAAQRLTVERSRSSINPRTCRQDQHAQLYLAPGEALALRVLVDASVLEIYANDRLCITSRVYPALHSSVEASAFVEGQADLDLLAWNMESIYPPGARSATAPGIQPVQAGR